MMGHVPLLPSSVSTAKGNKGAALSLLANPPACHFGLKQAAQSLTRVTAQLYLYIPTEVYFTFPST
jgi:hypothetical protein